MQVFILPFHLSQRNTFSQCSAVTTIKCLKRVAIFTLGYTDENLN